MLGDFLGQDFHDMLCAFGGDRPGNLVTQEELGGALYL